MFKFLKEVPTSVFRNLMIRGYAKPSCDPYVSVNADFEFDEALSYIKRYNEKNEENITITHFLLKAIACCFTELPNLNVKFFGKKLYQLPTVNIAVPVNLIDEKWERKSVEIGLIIIKEVEKKSLDDIAKFMKKGKKIYKSLISASIVKFFLNLIKYSPEFGYNLFFKIGLMINHNRYLYTLFQDIFGISTFLTNVGASVNKIEGVYFKSASFTITEKVGHFSSVIGVSFIEEKPVVKDGKIVIKKMLPLVCVFDHRVIDGYLSSKFGEKLASIFKEPEKYMGEI